jgi:hypothetical protein
MAIFRGCSAPGGIFEEGLSMLREGKLIKALLVLLIACSRLRRASYLIDVNSKYVRRHRISRY